MKLSSIQDQAQPHSSFCSEDMTKNRWLSSIKHCKISVFEEKLANFGQNTLAKPLGTPFLSLRGQNRHLCPSDCKKPDVRKVRNLGDK